MKLGHRALQIAYSLLLVTVGVEAGVKESRSHAIRLVSKPNGRGEFQLHLKFQIPEIPTVAHIDHVFLIVDQKFEMPVVADTARRSSARDTMEVPRGLVNKSHRPLMLTVYGFGPNKSFAEGSWIERQASRGEIIARGSLPPGAILQQERKRGRWSDEALKVAVAPSFHDLAREGNAPVDVVIGGSDENTNDLHPSRVDVDVKNLSGRLVIYYTEPSVLPHRMGR